MIQQICIFVNTMHKNNPPRAKERRAEKGAPLVQSAIVNCKTVYFPFKSPLKVTVLPLTEPLKVTSSHVKVKLSPERTASPQRCLEMRKSCHGTHMSIYPSSSMLSVNISAAAE